MKLPTDKRFIDFTGRKFGMLRVIEFRGRRGRAKVWLCRCDCSNESIVRGGNLARGQTISCGCYRILFPLAKTHGMSKSAEYLSYTGMKRRCVDKNRESYSSYGGRGISVCGRWLESFENFYADMGNKPTPKHTLDRIDNDGNYTPENCRWATPHLQSINQRKPKNNKSGTKGVCWHKQNKKWDAYISINKKHKLLGSFARLDDAIEARKAAELIHYRGLNLECPAIQPPER